MVAAKSHFFEDKSFFCDFFCKFKIMLYLCTRKPAPVGCLIRGRGADIFIGVY